MVPRPQHGLSLCAGGGGLDMGVQLAEPGFHTRCYVEWEEYPRQSIIAAQRAGYFAPAPIWDDVTTFDGRPWRGYIDTILAGYPCQSFSQAGQRKGEDDERYLWPEVARIIREVQPRWVFLENVAGHVSLGAETVLRELWDMGWTPAAGLFSAQEVGASHERLRWFCVAYRDPDAEKSSEVLDHPASARCDGAGQRAEADRESRERLPGAGCDELADASQPGSQGREQPGSPDERNGAAAHGSAAECRGIPLFPPGPSDADAWGTVLRSAPDMAPAASARDLFYFARSRELSGRMETDGGERQEAPFELRIRRMALGLAVRSFALRLLGNGVCPLAAGHAWRSLGVAHGLRPLDLEAACGDEAGGSTGVFVRMEE